MLTLTFDFVVCHVRSCEVVLVDMLTLACDRAQLPETQHTYRPAGESLAWVVV